MATRLAAVGLLLLLPACGSGCDRPQSQAMRQGESVTLAVAVERGFVMSVIDVNGRFYKQPTTVLRLEQGGGNTLPSPSLVAGPRDRKAVVTRDATGLVMSVGEQSFRLEGPLGCE